jgi:hypothetical protein
MNSKRLVEDFIHLKITSLSSTGSNVLVKTDPYHLSLFIQQPEDKKYVRGIAGAQV